MKETKKNPNETRIKTSIGGQALIEGIMMRGPKETAMAVRRPDGSMALEQWLTHKKDRAAITKLPFIRGVFNFIESMSFGYKCLMRSAEIAGFEEEDPKKGKANEAAGDAATGVVTPEPETTEEMTAGPEAITEETAPEETAPSESAPAAPETEKPASDAKEQEPEKEKSESGIGKAGMTAMMACSAVLGVVLALFLFLYLPDLIFNFVCRLIPAMNQMDKTGLAYSILYGCFKGVIKIAVLVAYMKLVSLMKDIRRTFQYHGAEHKTIFCYESGLELNVENVRKMRRFHPRCGTSFLILMVLVGVVFSVFISIITGVVMPQSVLESKFLISLVRTGFNLLFIPLIMGVGYELLKLAGRHDNVFTRIISAPGMWLQHITVLEPTDDMIECAIAAVKKVIPEDGSDRW